jgi:uncharacterized membrane protein
MSTEPTTRADIGSARLEAFSDGVLAILITIMAFQLVPPDGGHLADLSDRVPDVLAFALSFVFLGIYWNNHHHLFRVTDRIDAGVMWANMLLLFWLTLIPAATEWLGSHHGDSGPTALYGLICLAAGASYWLLVRRILHANPGSRMVEAIGRDRKGLASIVLYAAGAGLAFASPYAGIALFVVVSIMWFVPDRRLATL